MNETSRKPVIFLAFANDKENIRRNLGSITYERNGIRDALKRAQAEGLCEVVVEPDVSIDRIFDRFQEYQKRIAIFHYGGHAGSYELLLESQTGKHEVARAEGLVPFLAKQAGLQLVFLNGCCSQKQALKLRDAGLPAVIGTSQKINDEVATDLSIRFYKGLAAGISIDSAWEAAVDKLKTTDKTDYYKAKTDKEATTDSRDLCGEDEMDETEDDFPWHIFYQQDAAEAEIAKEWSLPKAANDPLFGLPRIPPGDLPSKPYRHLNWFTRKHAEIFFGRGHKIHELYYRVTDSEVAPIILLYGQSGVGKSSILEAGLIPRLEASHEILYCRREQELGLPGTLHKALTSADKTLPHSQAWRGLERELKKPVVVILDQVEEAYTRPKKELPEELKDFWTALKAIFADPAQRPKGKLILGFRKEWLAEIEARLAGFDLFHQKVFLERLDRNGIIEAIMGPARSSRLRKQYGLTIDDELLAGIIADDLEADRDSPIAPMLQILLTKMWDEAVRKNRSQPRFDRDLYDDLRKNFKALDDFLRQQFEALRQWKSEVVDSGLALDVLAYHTTKLGTAEQRTAEQLAQEYHHRQDVVPEFINRCKKEHFLLVDPAADQSEEALATATRLTHDTLAPLIRKQFDESDKPGQRATRILNSKIRDFRANEEGVWLDEADLTMVEREKNGMRTWYFDEHRLVEASRRKRAQKQRRIKEAKLAAEAQTARISYPQRSLLLAVEAVNISRHAGEPHTAAAENALRTSLSYTNGFGLSGHNGRINAVAISPNNCWLVTGSEDKTARLWDLSTNGPTVNPIVLTGHNGSVNAIAISSDNRWLVTCDGGTVWLWNLTVNSPVTNPVILTSPKGGINAIAISPNNHWLAAGGGYGIAWLWDLTASNPVAKSLVLTGHEDPIQTVTISPDNHWLVTGCADGTALLWDLTAKNPDAHPIPLVGHRGDIYDLVISSDNHWLVIGGIDNKVRIWDLTAKNPAANPIVLSGHEDAIAAVAISSDNRWLITGSYDRTARLWDLTANDPAANPVVLPRHERPVIFVAISSDNHWLVTDSDKTVRLWDLTADDPAANTIALFGHEDSVTAIAISSDSRWLVTGSVDGTARVWDLISYNSAANPIILADNKNSLMQVTISSNTHWVFNESMDGTAWLWDNTTKNPTIHPIVLPGPKISNISAVTFSSDNHWLMIGGYDKTARLWDLTSKNPVADPIILAGHEDGINAIAISSNNHWLATASGGLSSHNHTVWLWDLTMRNPFVKPTVLIENEALILKLAFSPNNYWFVVGGGNGTVWLWNLRTPNPIMSPTILVGHKHIINAIAISSNNHWLATGSSDKTVRLWNLTTEDPTAKVIVLTGHRNVITALAFSPNNRWLATGSSDNTARLWNLNTKDPFANSILLSGHDGEITTVTFTSDNNWLITGSWDKTVRMWNLNANNPAADPIVLTGHKDAIIAVAISPENHRLMTGSMDGTVRSWSLRIDELIDIACRTAGRNLTYDEWQRYFSEQAYRKTCPYLPIHPSFIEYGRNLAKNGDMDGAINIFKRAKELDQSLDFDPETEAQKLVAKGQTQK